MIDARNGAEFPGGKPGPGLFGGRGGICQAGFFWLAGAEGVEDAPFAFEGFRRRRIDPKNRNGIEQKETKEAKVQSLVSERVIHSMSPFG